MTVVLGVLLTATVVLARHKNGADALTHTDIPLYTCPNATANAKDYSLTFFAIGDWGRRGSTDQLRAARLMAEVRGP